MYTIGVDMTTVSRIKKSMENPRFAPFVFGEKERELFCAQNPKYHSLAANFAAKEAFAKALGSGVRGFGLNEVEVLRDDMGAPYFAFSGKALEIVLSGGYTAQVSLSHEGDTAIAMVLLEKGMGIKKL